MSRKIEAGDIRGAIRLASANDILADFDDETFSALQAKHPSPPLDSSIPLPLSSADFSVPIYNNVTLSVQLLTHFLMVLQVVPTNFNYST